MNNYEKLRELICEEEEIRKQIEIICPEYETIVDFEEIELRHILWYSKIKSINTNYYWDTIDEIQDIDFSLPLSSQDEVCEAIYNYLITL